MSLRRSCSTRARTNICSLTSWPRRARDLNRGDRALVDLPEPHTHTELAMAEVQANKLHLVRKQKSKVLVSLIKNE